MAVPVVNVFAPLNTSVEVGLFCTTPVTFVPKMLEMVVVAAPVPEFVTLPVMFTLAVERVMVPAPLAFRFKLPVPVMPPLKVKLLAVVARLSACELSVTAPLKILAAEEVILATPVLPEATIIGFAKVPAKPPSSVALAEPVE
jgi:hypothetical protein